MLYIFFLSLVKQPSSKNNNGLCAWKEKKKKIRKEKWNEITWYKKGGWGRLFGKYVKNKKNDLLDLNFLNFLTDDNGIVTSDLFGAQFTVVKRTFMFIRISMNRTVESTTAAFKSYQINNFTFGYRYLSYYLLINHLLLTVTWLTLNKHKII